MDNNGIRLDIHYYILCKQLPIFLHILYSSYILLGLMFNSFGIHNYLTNKSLSMKFCPICII